MRLSAPEYFSIFAMIDMYCSKGTLPLAQARYRALLAFYAQEEM
jgi:hypothetical protein